MNRRSYLVVIAAALALAVSGSAFAAKPNFSGDWKLNAGKSDFGPMPGPEKMDRKINHNDPEIKITTTQSGPQGEMTTNLAYKTDGTESVNKVREADVKSVAKWDGNALVVSSKRDFQGMEIVMNERWTLSEDGKSLTIVNKINTPQGDFEIKVVMDKQ